MTSPNPFTVLPTPGCSTTSVVKGRTITLSSLAGNRWNITETIGTFHIGHGQLVAVGDLYAISAPSGNSPRSAAWPALLGTHLDTAA